VETDSKWQVHLLKTGHLFDVLDDDNDDNEFSQLAQTLSCQSHDDTLRATWIVIYSHTVQRLIAQDSTVKRPYFACIENMMYNIFAILLELRN